MDKNRIFLMKEDGRRLQITEKQAKRYEASPFYICRYRSDKSIKEIRHVQKAARLMGRSEILSWRQKEIAHSCFALNHKDGTSVDRDIQKTWNQEKQKSFVDTGTVSKLMPSCA